MQSTTYKLPSLKVGKHAVLKASILAALGMFQAHSHVSAEMIDPPFVGKSYTASVGIRDDGVMVVFGGNQNTFIPKPLSEQATPVNHPDNVILLNVDKVNNVQDTSFASGLIMEDGGVSTPEFSWNIPEPQVLLTDKAVQTVEISDISSFAITESGEAFVWSNRGSNANSPIQLNISEPVEDIETNYREGAALTQDGNVYTWYDMDNPQPSQLSTPEPVEEITLDYTGGVARSQTGNLFVWESTSTAQVSTISFNSPIEEVIGGFDKGIAVADDALYAWEHSSGNLLAEEILDQPIQDAVGYFDSGFALTDDGEVYGWYWSGYDWLIGKVMDNVKSLYDTKITSNITYVADNNGDIFSVTYQSNSGIRVWETTKMTGLPNNVEAIYASYTTLTALTSNGEVYTWDNDSTNATKVPFSQPVVSVSSGYTGHSLVMLEDGMMCGWGGNNYGQLGSNNPNPVPVNSPVCLEDLTVKKPATTLQCDEENVSVATYQTEKKKLSFDKLAMELYSPWTDEPTGKFALFEATGDTKIEMQAYPGFQYFRLPTKIDMNFVETIDDNSCYPTYSALEETVVFPKVTVPLVGVDWNNVVTETETVDCYTATMKQAITQKAFRLIDAAPVDCK